MAHRRTNFWTYQTHFHTKSYNSAGQIKLLMGFVKLEKYKNPRKIRSVSSVGQASTLFVLGGHFVFFLHLF